MDYQILDVPFPYGIRYIFVLFPYLSKKSLAKQNLMDFSERPNAPPKKLPTIKFVVVSSLRDDLACVGLPNPLYTKLGCSFGSHLAGFRHPKVVFFCIAAKKIWKTMEGIYPGIFGDSFMSNDFLWRVWLLYFFCWNQVCKSRADVSNRVFECPLGCVFCLTNSNVFTWENSNLPTSISSY